MSNDFGGKKRSELPDEVFGIPQERKYPMPDEKHIRSAIKLFNHVDPKYEEQLAKAVIKNMKKYNIDGSVVGPNNRLRKYLPKDMIKESSSILEGYLKSDEDIYYNKNKFDSGEINLCFITGLSGSGKSTMGRGMSSKDVEHYEIDDVILNGNFTMENFKEYGDLIYSFFKGPGKRFKLVKDDDAHNDKIFKETGVYEREITKAFVKHAISYAKAHKNKKFVCDGIWIFMFIEPELLKDCAVYIKGTSSVKSLIRATTRDIKNDIKDGYKVGALTAFKMYIRRMKEDVIYSRKNQKELKSFRSYFEKQSIPESSVSEWLFNKRPSDNNMKKLSNTIITTIRPIVMTQTNKTRARNIGLVLKCSLENIDKNTVCVLILDGPQDKRDTDDARYILENIQYRIGNELYPMVTKITMGDGDEGCLYFTINTRSVKNIGETYMNNNALQEETRIEGNKLPKHIYHISYVNHDGETFEPRTYDNDNVKNGMERKVKRVCFSDSVTRALYSIFPNGAYDADFYVHVPNSDCKVYKTTSDDIYDADITHELWIKEPVQMKCIGKIHVNGVSDKTHTIDVDKDKAGYGKKKYHETRWNWVEKYEKDETLYESYISGDDDMINEGGYIFTIKILPIIWKGMFRANQYDYKWVREEYLPKIVSKCKTVEEVAYLRRDVNTAIGQLEAMKINIKGILDNDEKIISRLSPSFIKNVQQGKVTVKDVDEHIRFLKGPYRKMLNDKYKEIKNKSIKESSISEHGTTSGAIVGSNQPLYFYHMVDSGANLSKGLLSLEYMYHHSESLFLKNASKYRDRLCNGWDIYPGRDPKSLTAEEIYEGIKKFRNEDNLNSIYFFRYPPYSSLDKRFDRLYKYKKLYRININDTKVKSIIKNINYGWIDSNTYNDPLDRKYYETISPEDYFNNFDPDKGLLFSTLHHISIEVKNGYIPMRLLEEVKVPNTIEDIISMEESSIQEYGTTGGTIVGSNQPDSVYIVNYMQNNVFSGYKEPRFGICKKGMKDLHVLGDKDKKLHYISDKDKFKEEASDIKVYRYRGKPKHAFHDIIETTTDSDKDIYRLITGRNIENRKDIDLDEEFVKEECFWDELDAIKSCTEATILDQVEDLHEIPILTETVQGRPYNYYRDINGVFVQNEITKIRSKSYDSIDDIPSSEVDIIKRGYLV